MDISSGYPVDPHPTKKCFQLNQCYPSKGIKCSGCNCRKDKLLVVVLLLVQLQPDQRETVTEPHQPAQVLDQDLEIMFCKTPTFFFTVMIGAMRSTLANFLFPDFDLIWNFVRIPFYDVAVQDKHH